MIKKLSVYAWLSLFVHLVKQFLRESMRDQFLGGQKIFCQIWSNRNYGSNDFFGFYLIFSSNYFPSPPFCEKAYKPLVLPLETFLPRVPSRKHLNWTPAGRIQTADLSSPLAGFLSAPQKQDWPKEKVNPWRRIRSQPNNIICKIMLVRQELAVLGRNKTVFVLWQFHQSVDAAPEKKVDRRGTTVNRKPSKSGREESGEKSM